MTNNDDDIVSNNSGNRTFQEIVEARMSRRGFLGSGLAAAAALSLGGVDALLRAVPAAAKTNGNGGPLLGFQGIPVSAADTVVVPPGYTAEVLIAWGDPVSDGPEFKQDASNSAAEQALQWGTHNDGVVYFPINGSARGLLVQNNEYADEGLLFPNGITDWTAEKTNKSLNAHGVSIIEIAKQGGKAISKKAASGRSCVRRVTPGASPATRRLRSAARRPETTASRQARIRPAQASWELSTTARWDSRHGAPTSRVKRTSTDFFPNDVRAGPAQRSGKTLRNLSLRFGFPVAYYSSEIQRRHRTERTQPFWLGCRDRSIRSDVDAGKAHCPRSP